MRGFLAIELEKAFAEANQNQSALAEALPEALRQAQRHVFRSDVIDR